MLTCYLKIRNKLGLHARPAAKLANLARNFHAEIKVIKNNKKADAKSILDLLTLACKFDDKIKIEVKGEDEVKAFGLILCLLESEIGERVKNGN